MAVHADPSAAASVCGGLRGSLQGPPGHFQGSLPVLVPTNKSSSVDEDAALNPAELRQRLVTDAAPLFQQGQPVTGRQKGACVYRWTLYGQLLTSCWHTVNPNTSTSKKNHWGSQHSFFCVLKYDAAIIHSNLYRNIDIWLDVISHVVVRQAYIFKQFKHFLTHD